MHLRRSEAGLTFILSGTSAATMEDRVLGRHRVLITCCRVLQ